VTPRRTTGRFAGLHFGHDKAAKAAGFLLAGKLVTDIPKSRAPNEVDIEEIAAVVQRLIDTTRDWPDAVETGVWRDGSKPADGLSPPFPDDALNERVRRCVVVNIYIDKDDTQRRADDAHKRAWN
jgi:hypothetical protein